MTLSAAASSLAASPAMADSISPQLFRMRSMTEASYETTVR